jgi:hypothetical protein
MRATNEWNTFGSKYGGNGVWLYDTNSAAIAPFFTYGAQRAKPYGANSMCYFTKFPTDLAQY